MTQKDERVKNIMLGTPAYGGWVHVDYVNNVLNLIPLLERHANARLIVTTLGNESLITRGRNTIASLFYHMKQMDYLLFIDADVWVEPGAIVSMLNYVDTYGVVGIPVCLKGLTQDYKPVYNFGEVVEIIDPNISQKTGLYHLFTTEHIGAAVMMINRKVIEEMAKHVKRYAANPLTRSNADLSEIQYHFDFFGIGVDEERELYLSEDYWFCKKVRELGFQIAVLGDWFTKHNAMIAFTPRGIAMS